MRIPWFSRVTAARWFGWIILAVGLVLAVAPASANAHAVSGATANGSAWLFADLNSPVLFQQHEHDGAAHHRLTHCVTAGCTSAYALHGAVGRIRPPGPPARLPLSRTDLRLEGRLPKPDLPPPRIRA